MSKVALLIIASLFVLASTQSNDCLKVDQFGQGQDWSADWANWSFSNGQTNPTGDCAGHQMVGGLCNFGQGDTATGTFSNLPRHKKIRVQFKFYAVASWDSEWFYASMDGAVFHTQQSQWSNSNVGNLCGSSWSDNFYDVDYTIAHSDSSVSFYFRTTINQGACDEAMAFSDFKLYMLQENDQCVTEATANAMVDAAERDCNLVHHFDNENWDDADFAQWTFTNVESNTGNDNSKPSFVCAGFRMCGGYSYFGSGATASTVVGPMGAHSYLRVAYKQHAVASWDNEIFYTQVDSTVVQQQTYAWGNGNQVCGVGWNDNMDNQVDTIVAHSTPLATITLYSSINQGSLDESMGFSDFMVDQLDGNQSCQSIVEDTTCLEISQFGQGENWANDWANWSFSNGQTNPTGNCQGFEMVGGLCNFGQGDTATGTFSNLPRHKKLRVVFNFYAVASWDSEWFYASLDGAVFHTQQSGWSNSNVGNLCGSSWADNFYVVDYTIAHTDETAVFHFRSTINQGACDEAMAFSDFKLFMLQEGEACVDNSTAASYTETEESVCNVVHYFDNENWSDADFAQWTFNNVENNTGNDNSKPGFVCDGYRMAGGYSYLGVNGSAETTMQNIAPHSYLRIAYKQHAVASWDNETFYTELDGVVIQQATYAWGNGVQVCGVGWNDNMDNQVDTIVAHMNSVATIKLSSSINQGSLDESMGFSDFEVEGLDINQSCVNTCGLNNYCYQEAAVCTTDCHCEGERVCVDGTCQGDANNQEACYPERSACNVAYGFMQGRFQDSDFDGWYFNTGAAMPSASCGNYEMMGGYGQFGQGAEAKYVLANLPSHSQLRIRFQFYACASWDNETMYVDLDGQEVYSQTAAWGASNVGNICGSSWADNFYSVDFTVDHSAQFMTLDWRSTINQGANDEAWGISDLVIDALSGGECQALAEYEQSCLVMQEFRQNAFTDADYLTWRFNQGADIPYYDCQGNAQMCGGGGNFGQGATGDMTLANLPEHYFLRIKMAFYAVASWDNETFYAELDGANFYEQQSAWGNSNVGNLCGSSWADNFYTVDEIVAHTSNEANFAFWSTINQGSNDESWGFSDFSIEWLNSETYCTNYPACDHMCYYVDEWYNEMGSHQCLEDCDCDGQRTCEAGWCDGDARPDDHPCSNIPSEGGSVEYDNSNDQKCDVVTFYSECYYEGMTLEVTERIDCLDWEPKSICIPRGKQVKVNDLCDFQGQDAYFTENVSCINEIDFEFLAEMGITLKAKGDKLKTNLKHSKEAQVTLL